MNLPNLAMGQANFPEMYEHWLVAPLFRPFTEIALVEVGLSAGDRLLDIACGTGILARVANERLAGAGRIVGVDINPGMLAVARARAPEIDWREGNASALPLADQEEFDIVACHQGLQFFPDKPAAAAEMRRALAKGGRLAVATWRTDREMPFFCQLRKVAERHLGPIVDPRYSSGDAASIEALLTRAGFDNVRFRVLSRTIRFEQGMPFVRMNAMAFVGVSAAGKAMGEEERNAMVEKIVSDSIPVLKAWSDGEALIFEATTNLVTATG